MENGKQSPTVFELTVKAIVSGVVIGILFGAANAYLGLRVGITVSASIPAAVMGISLFRALKRSGAIKDFGILETNMVQTIGSAGESLAAGIIYTIPGLILLGLSPGLLNVFVLGSIGGILGIMFMVPLRQFLIEREHGKLIYPEGTACAGVLVAGQEGGAKGGIVFAGLGIGAVYEFLMSGLGLWKNTAVWRPAAAPSMQLAAESSPALVGVGYVLGPRVASYMFGGGALGWLVFIPAIKLFGGLSGEPIYPATAPIADLAPKEIWNFYLRYIGAGAVVFGGIYTLVRSLPLIAESFKSVFGDLTKKLTAGTQAESGPRRDLPGAVVLGGLALCGIAMMALPKSLVPGDAAGTALAILFAFFFVAVSSRVVGIVGSSSNPVSGMTIAALLGTTLVFKLLGLADQDHQAAALAVGAIVCVSAAISGDTSQDLKTGHLVGATPWKQQLGELIGVLTSVAVIGVVVLRLHAGYGIGSEKLPAPQATLMSLVVKGVLSGDLPWDLVIIGMATAAVVEIMGIPALPFAVGLYLPLAMSAPIMIGGIVKWLIDRRAVHKAGGHSGEDFAGDKGLLFASGLIAGSAFIGMAIGLLYSLGGGVEGFMKAINFSEGEMPLISSSAGTVISIVAVAALSVLLYRVAGKRDAETSDG